MKLELPISITDKNLQIGLFKFFQKRSDFQIIGLQQRPQISEDAHFKKTGHVCKELE